MLYITGMIHPSTSAALSSGQPVGTRLRVCAGALSVVLLSALGCDTYTASNAGSGGGLATGGTSAGSGGTGGGTAGAGGAPLYPTGGTFVRPGALDGKAELDFVKTQIAAGAEPWTGHFNAMKSMESLTTAPSPQVTVDANTSAAEAARNDARRAYGNALAWYLTGDEAYAEQAILYLNGWADLQSIAATDEQNRLLGGWLGSLFGPAADLMLGYSAWAAADIEKLRAMFKLAFYPVLNTASTWNGNVDLHQISAMMAIAVFNEDAEEFNLGLTRLAARMPMYFYLTTDPQPSASFWSNPAQWVSGLTQETCRDNNHHAQFGLSGAIGAMETAWHQGVDVYSLYQDRMVPALELMGLQCSSGSMQGTCTDDVTSADVYDTWEIAFNHYHTRQGLELPNTWTMISTKVRPYVSNPGSWNIFYETLTHADIQYP
jgi:hypothetical protein